MKYGYTGTDIEPKGDVYNYGNHGLNRVRGYLEIANSSLLVLSHGIPTWNVRPKQGYREKN